MNLRKILLVTYHFPPSAASGSFRLLGFARHLPTFAWQPVVVAPPQLPWEPFDLKLAQQVPPATVVYPAPYPRHWPKAVRWAAPYAVWLPGARKVCRQAMEIEKPDVVLTSGPPHWVHLLGRDLQKRFGIPWLADFRDPWVRGFDKPPRFSPLSWWERHWEKKVLKRADLVLANAPYASRKIQAAFPAQAHKIRTLTNGFDPPDSSLRAEPRTGPLRIVHAGQIYAGRDPRPFLDAVERLSREAFQVVFLGRTTGHGVDVAEEVERRGLEQTVLVREQATYAQSLVEMHQADILMLLDSPGRRVGVPAKLYEYFGAGRAVFALAEPDGDTACVLRDSGLPHALAPPTDADAIAEQLRQLLDCVHANRNVVRSPALNRFTREHLAGVLTEWLDELCGTTRESLSSFHAARQSTNQLVKTS